jgi:spore germination cell wall hydrolase CwlJ-like protein
MLKELILSSMMSLTPIATADTVPTKQQFITDEAFCLAQNVYFEARNQPLAGQMAVISVTVNRVNDSRFPNTICQVVYEGPHRPSWKDPEILFPVRHRCQFSWYCDGLSDRIHDMETFEQIFTLTMGVVDGSYTIRDITEGATHYHADYVTPAWAKTKTKTIEIEDHIFYRWEQTESE